jgi:hypothetical protein
MSNDLKNIPYRQELKPQLVKCSATVFPNCFCQFGAEKMQASENKTTTKLP